MRKMGQERIQDLSAGQIHVVFQEGWGFSWWEERIFRGLLVKACESKNLLFFLFHDNFSSLLPFCQILTLSGSPIFLLRPWRTQALPAFFQLQSLLPGSFCCPLVLLSLSGLGRRGRGPALGEVGGRCNLRSEKVGTLSKTNAFSFCTW